MPSPFPGMDPYLEHPEHWRNVHASLIIELRNRLARVLAPRYFVSVEQREYFIGPGELKLVGLPDAALVETGLAAEPERAFPSSVGVAPRIVTLPIPEEVRERYLEVRETGTGKVVTVLELLSLTNKRPGIGRELYQKKRGEILMTLTHLVELDLLRAGARLPVEPEDVRGDYRIIVSRSRHRPKADLYSFSVRDVIPPFPLPLARGEPELEVELKSVHEAVYDQARYDLVIDYSADPVPPLEEDDAGWARTLLADKGLAG